MMRKLELDALRADVTSVNRLLRSRTQEIDPIGFLQFSRRREQLQEKIDELQNAPFLKGSVALFFAGEPVSGSRGIRADFAGKAVEIFQDVVSKQFAAVELGEMGERGPIPMKANSDLLLTDVARGSVGLVLEEAGENDTIARTPLSIVLDRVVEMLAQTARPERAAFDELLEHIDQRQLVSLRNFFQHLDDAHATLRLVEGESDIIFDSAAIQRARTRTSVARIDEREDDQMNGRLYLLPGHRRFELHIDGDPPTEIFGSVSREFAREHLQAMQAASDVVGKRWRVKILIRSIQRQNGEPRISYSLKGLIQRLD
ncbi:hypothetical protein SAMN04515620_12673 [Collimonas sp. OK607]|uniref:hypothetical protein n=1 Tax=Collimonas sp. OK607 TaxID=1798194 RepID=UPI0008E21887|nr:hypothetical protein [Collimonas sp. OK607]SFB21560.1 hypothetical protein SAMN04515620_12673 [Collimonas sp. OK607]